MSKSSLRALQPCGQSVTSSSRPNSKRSLEMQLKTFGHPEMWGSVMYMNVSKCNFRMPSSSFFIVKLCRALAWNCQEKIECNTVLATERGAARFQGSKVWALSAQPKNLMLRGKKMKKGSSCMELVDKTYTKSIRKASRDRRSHLPRSFGTTFLPALLLKHYIWYNMNVLYVVFTVQNPIAEQNDFWQTASTDFAEKIGGVVSAPWFPNQKLIQQLLLDSWCMVRMS